MTQFVDVQLSRPWPTAQGLRRPQEGPIRVSIEEAERIVEEKHGKIIRAPKAEKEPKTTPTPTPTPTPATMPTPTPTPGS